MSNTGDVENQTGNLKAADGAALFLAIVRATSAEVVVFDARGEPRTFTYDAGTGTKICFSSHGHDADDFLTPCFNNDGHHGVPEESCFCGIETPHLHAHVHDPVMCYVVEGGCGSKKKTQGRAEDALMKLAKLTLEPTEEEDEVLNAPLLHIPVSDQMPNECTAHAFFNSPSNAHEASRRNRRRLHKVQHDDHEDFLVIDEETGELFLEHPHTECGNDDLHGKFSCVGKRKLTGALRGNDVSLHFFEEAPNKFSIFEYIKERFAPDPGLLAAIRPVELQATKQSPLPTKPAHVHKKDCCSSGVCTAAASFLPPELLDTIETDSKTVRSMIVCTQICCSSEIPGVNKVMESLDGVSRTMINVPLKEVVVDHDPSVVSAKEIEAALNKARFGATLKRDGGATLGGGVGRSHFHVQKICCASEIPAINKILEPIDGVANVAINVTTKLVYVDHDTSTVSAQELCDALNRAAFGATLKRDAGAVVESAVPIYVRSTLLYEDDELDTNAIKNFMGTFKPTHMETCVVDETSKVIILAHNHLLLPLQDIVIGLEEATGAKTVIVTNGADDVVWDFPSYEEAAKNLEADSTEDHKWPKPQVVLSGVFWLVSMLSFIGGNWEYLKYVSLLSVAFGIPSIALKAITTMRRCMFDSNCLMFFAALGALALQEYTEAAAVTFLFAISEWLEVRATTRARNALSAIVNLRPDHAFIVHPSTNEQMMIPASAVPVGAVVAVKTGDKIPCDGVVVEGQSAVDESSLTGESRPVKKGPKSLVSGGTVNCGQNHLMIQTTASCEKSAINRLVALVEEAQANRSDTEKIVDEFAKVYTPIVVLAALLMCTIPWAFGKETGNLWTHNGLVLIVVACPCALIISTPVTYVAGLAATAQRGVLIKGGAHLEALGLVKTICFDKTGTLTQGSFALISIDTIGTKHTRKEVLEYLVLMEARANHPLALAIVDGARNEGVVPPKHMKVQAHSFMAGEGLSGIVEGKQVYVGNSRLFNRLGLLDDLPAEIENLVANWEAMAGTVGFMSIEGSGLVCAYCVADAVRSESSDIIEELGKLGIVMHMLTGDNRDAARAIGNLVGLRPECINSELLPEEKLRFITNLKGGQGGRSVLANPLGKRDLVCHVGDGVNDAPALAAADIGVAMGVGAALAMETADVTLLDSNLKKLVYSIKMGRRVLWTIKENVAFSLVVKALVLGFTVVGKVALWAAIVSDVGAMLVVTLNGMRLLPSSIIDREKMGDVANSTYRSQVSDVSHHTKGVDLDNLDTEIGRSGDVESHGRNHEQKSNAHECGGHSHDQRHAKSIDQGGQSHSHEHSEPEIHVGHPCGHGQGDRAHEYIHAEPKDHSGHSHDHGHAKPEGDGKRAHDHIGHSDCHSHSELKVHGGHSHDHSHSMPKDGGCASD